MAAITPDKCSVFSVVKNPFKIPLSIIICMPYTARVFVTERDSLIKFISERSALINFRTERK